MSKKLLIAVLTFGFLFVLSGAVIGSDDRGDLGRVHYEFQEIDFSGDRSMPILTDAGKIDFPGSKTTFGPVTKYWPPDWCDQLDYSEGDWWYGDPVGGTDPYFGTGGYNVIDSINGRFNLGSENYSCTLLAASIGLWGTATVGTPDMAVCVWDDDGEGRPANLLGSVVVPNAALPVTDDYVTVDLTSLGPLIFEDGESFHVGISVVGGAYNPASGQLWIAEDNNDHSLVNRTRMRIYDPVANPLNWYWWTAAWETCLAIGVDYCCAYRPFTDCYTEENFCPVADIYIYTLPDYGYYQRHTQAQLVRHGAGDTLVWFEVGLYIPATLGAPGIDAFIWADDGTGAPDTTNDLWSDTKAFADWDDPAGYPDWQRFEPNFVFSPSETYYVGFRVDYDTFQEGDTIAMLMDDGIGDCAYFGRRYPLVDYPVGSGETVWAGSNRNIATKFHICKSMFDLCQRVSEYCPEYYLYSMPHGGANGRIGGFELVTPFFTNGCQLASVRIQTDDIERYGGNPADAYNYASYVRIYDSDGGQYGHDAGLPGTLLYETTIEVGEYVNYPGWNVIDVSAAGIWTTTPLWVGIVSQKAYDAGYDYYAVGDDDECGDAQGFLRYDYDGSWVDYHPSHLYIDAMFCCEKPPERECGDPEDWPQGAHDGRRTAASNNNTGDAKNLQTVLWRDYQGHPTTPGLPHGTFGRPIIYDTIVVVPYQDRLIAYGINGDGLGGPNIMWTVVGHPWIGGSNFNNSPLAKDGKIYFGGSSRRSFSCFDIYTGAQIWSRNITTTNFDGNTDYTIPAILDMDGTEVVYFTTHIGELYALEAATGANWANWTTNPVQLDGDPTATLSTNGVDVLYVGTDGTNPSLGDLVGTLYAINAADGSVLWTVEEEDMYGHEIDGDTLGNVTTEIFQGPIAVDVDGSMYTIAGYNTEMYGEPSGTYYKIDSEGNILWGVVGKFPRYTGIMIDRNAVYITSLVAWIQEWEAIDAHDKYTGEILWRTDTVLFKIINWVEGALDCRTLEDDMIYQPNMDYRFMVVNSDDGTIEFEYTYYDSLLDRGGGTAIGDGYVVMTNRNGDVFCFANDETKGPRPRLRFLMYEDFQPVEPTTTSVTFEDVFMNNGGANLTGTISVDEDADEDDVLEEGPIAVDPNRLTRLQGIAGSMIDIDYDAMARYAAHNQPSDAKVYMETGYAQARSSGSAAAYGIPAWLTALTTPTFDIAPDETFDVSYDVEASLVTRGPHWCYATVSSNDTYFINSPDRDPIIVLGVIGGCLEAADIIEFGDTPNLGPVFNHSMIADQVHQFWDIDGDDARYWQGGLIFGAAKYRIAMNLESWHGADANDFWNSILPDANLYGTCPPEGEHMELGKIWDDGANDYIPVEGTVYHSAYIDSVIDFNCDLEGWAWDNVDCPYDNDLTIGLKIYEWVYGAEHAELGDFVIKKMRITNRNNRALTGIGVGSMNDYDLTHNGFDIFYFNEDYAIAYGQSCIDTDPVEVWGQGTIPYTAPNELNNRQRLYNVHTIDAQQGGWEDDYIFLDSIYYYMRNFTGQTSQPGIDMAIPCDALSESDDREVWMGFDFRDYAEYGEAVVGFYFFGFEEKSIVDDADFFQAFAVKVNQWAGFGRGDNDGDNAITLADVVAEFNLVAGDPGPKPLFEHLADVDNSGAVDMADVYYMVDYWFGSGPGPVGDWVLPETPIP
ncbi:MAG: PQQ-like beta-propeller repeat protein [Candidatus Zixiibacteriota bacterium]|nr:MAG: PQQ-like beta-propeller repeat protein [candidate division Zixibacteria bacterium]